MDVQSACVGSKYKEYTPVNYHVLIVMVKLKMSIIQKIVNGCVIT